MIDKIYIEKLKSNFSEAVRVILANKVRTLLTSLGIIFGVAAVITMLAIGSGAEKEILAQLELVGVNNIVITPIPDEEDTDSEEESEDGAIESKRFSKGLDMLDVASIRKNIPSVKTVSPEIILETYVIKKGRQNSIKLIGIAADYFATSNISIESGKNFSDSQSENSLPVCIIGKKIEKKLFPGESAIGKQIKVKDVWLQVIGVIEEKFISDNAQENLGIRDMNLDIYIPIKTFLVRYKDRKIITDKPIDMGGGGMVFFGRPQQQGPKKRIPRGNYHQIDKLVVQVDNSSQLNATADVLSRMLKRRHNGMLDFEISIPIQLLKQQQKTKQIFNVVLSIIAGISLLIGGIGIMNIMLASVLERTTGIETILTLNSILLSFFVATLIGLIFGIAPAKSAASKSPIEAIRHE
jgi:putative ABC transport system permease protein